MAYSNFTLAKLKKDYGLQQKDIFLFENIDIKIVEASQRLKDDLQEAKGVPLVRKSQIRIHYCPYYSGIETK
jgi:hypothetical protein